MWYGWVLMESEMIMPARRIVLDEFIMNYKPMESGFGMWPSQNTAEREYLYSRLKKIYPRVSFLADRNMPSF